MSLHYDSIEQLPEHLQKQAKEKLGIAVSGQQASEIANSSVKQNKYHVSPVEDRTHHGIVFGSKKEAAKAAELDLCIQAGKIDFYLRQVPFIVGYDPLTKYVADFVTFAHLFDDYKRLVWIIEVIETKGMYAPGAKRKLALFRKKFPNLTLDVC